MYQVFNNLVKNSMEAMTQNGVITIEGSVKDGHMVVTGQDTGVGIAPEALERIFDPFFTTKGKQGTGLGMAIVKTIVTAHRGDIACESRSGQGARFSLRLPLR